jgi:flagellar biosynthetic protein FliR
MESDWIEILLPFFLVTARVTAFFVTLPLFGWEILPTSLRLAIALLATVFFAIVLPPAQLNAADVHWVGASLLVAREALCGLALGLVARLIFTAVEQGMLIGTEQMGFMDAEIIDPTTDENQQTIPLIFQMLFAVLFLGMGGHHLLLRVIDHSYQVFPVGRPVDAAGLVEGVVNAGSMMLVLALKLAAPLLAGFLLLSVMLGVIARVMPEMNVLMESFPLRVGLGIVLSLAVMRTLNSFVAELADWLGENLVVA